MAGVQMEAKRKSDAAAAAKKSEDAAAAKAKAKTDADAAAATATVAVAQKPAARKESIRRGTVEMRTGLLWLSFLKKYPSNIPIFS